MFFKRNFYLIVLIVFVLFLVILLQLVLNIYVETALFSKVKNSSRLFPTIKIDSPTSSLKQIILDTPIPINEPMIMNSWIFNRSKLCGVRLPQPPNDSPYAQSQIGRWVYSESSETFPPFYSVVKLSFVSNGDTNKSLEGEEVDIHCSPNLAHYQSQSLLSLVNAKLTDKNSQNAASLIGVEKIGIWGNSVIAVQYKGGPFLSGSIYILATDKYIYLIEKKSFSNQTLLKTATDSIFYNLLFD